MVSPVWDLEALQIPAAGVISSRIHEPGNGNTALPKVRNSEDNGKYVKNGPANAPKI
jgi:hypothetical protein